MDRPPPEELAVIERLRRAFLTRDREVWIATVGRDVVTEPPADWPGARRVTGADEAWDLYMEFNDPFETVGLEYLNFEKRGRLTVFEVRNALVGRASGAPMELVWTAACEFDPDTQTIKSVRWYHTRDEALAAADGLAGASSPSL